MFKYHGFSGDCPKPPLPRAVKPSYADLERQLSERDRALEERDDRIAVLEKALRETPCICLGSDMVCYRCAALAEVGQMEGK